MSTNEHVDRIREFCDELRAASAEHRDGRKSGIATDPDYRFMGRAADLIRQHTDALARRLAEAEARVKEEKREKLHWMSVAAKAQKRGALLQAVVTAVEENGQYNDMHDDVWEALDALTMYDLAQRKKATEGGDDEQQ